MNQTPIQYAIGKVMPEAIQTGLLVSLCTIQSPDGGYTPGGAPDTGFSNVAGLVNIPCLDSVFSVDAIQATEQKALDDILTSGYKHIFLNGYYPVIIANVRNGWRAIVDGTTYDLLGAEPDSQNTQTRLHLRLMTV